MKNICTWVLSVLVILTLTNCKTLEIDKNTYDSLPDGLYANLKTSKGDILVKFYEKEAPVTVANFVGLAEGKIANNKKKSGVPYYDGTIFHRVIKNFMIQGGDALGNGTGDPGYKFDDEKNDLVFDGKGYLAMANSGPNTNGSQFFITEVPTTWLDGRHTIFGKVVKGENVIDAIATSPTGAQDKPSPDILLEKVSIFGKGDAYKHYHAAEIFNEGKSKIQERNKEFDAKKDAEMAKHLEEMKHTMQKTADGLYYKINEKGSGKQPAAGDVVKVHYAGRLTDGKEFDNSYRRHEPIEFPVGVGHVIKGWDEGIMLLHEGDKATFLIPPDLGYGARGAGGVIPPNAWLIFEVELVKVGK